MGGCEPVTRHMYEEEMVPVTALEIEFRTSLTQPLRYAANIEKICTCIHLTQRFVFTPFFDSQRREIFSYF